jgi:hypothetical protein
MFLGARRLFGEAAVAALTGQHPNRVLPFLKTNVFPIAMCSQLTVGPTLVGSPEELRVLNESLEKAVRVVRQLTKPLERVSRVSRQLSNNETVKQWVAVKPIFESAPPHEKRRLWNMTIDEAFAFYSRRARVSALRNGVADLLGGRARGAARAPRRRSVRSSGAKARAPGSRSSDDDPSDLDLDSCFSPATSGLFCVPSHVQRLSAESSSPELGGARGRGGVGMKPTLPLISQPQTPTQLRKRVFAQLAILAVNNGKPPVKAAKR